MSYFDTTRFDKKIDLDQKEVIFFQNILDHLRQLKIYLEQEKLGEELSGAMRAKLEIYQKDVNHYINVVTDRIRKENEEIEEMRQLRRHLGLVMDFLVDTGRVS